jgi:hypothetical protein
MSIRATGRVVDGHLRVDIPVELEENAEVELAEVTGGAGFDEEMDSLLEAALDEADAAFARGERGVDAKEALSRLRARARDEAVSGLPASKG